MPFIEIEKSEKQEPWSNSKMHCHTHYELYFLLEGARHFFLDTSLFTLDGCVLLIIPPFTMHKTEGGNFSRVNVNVEPSYLNPYESEVLQKSACKSILIPNEHIAVIKNQLDELRDCYGGARNPYLLRTLFGYLIYYVDKYCGAGVLPGKITFGKTADSFVIKIMEYLNDAYGEKITLDHLSELFYMSKISLHKRFVRATGITVMNYLLNLRLVKANQLLTTTSKTIEEISSATGFSSANYFGLIFKSKTGVSPMQYRKKQQEKT
ncbi:AraC family transcriptional regulator [Clostridia bacterium]|nr:AraC family transcriptional regulator [Clostridia bacterium]